METFIRFLAPVIWIGVVSACTPPAESFSAIEVMDSAGVRIVRSREPRWTSGEDWTVSFEPRQTIGVLNGPEEYQLVDVAAAARRSDGDLLVVDRGSRTVRLYDREGTFLRTLGGPGSGPGEFTDPGSILVAAGDSVVVWDNAFLRTTRFDPDGELADVKTVDLGAMVTGLDLERVGTGLEPGTRGTGGKPGTIARGEEPLLYPGAMEPLADGGLLVRLIDKSGKSSSSGFYRPRSGLLRVSGDLSVVDTLIFFGDAEVITVDAPWGPFPVVPPQAKQTWIAHQGDPPRICVGDQEGPQIVCFGVDGNRTSIRWTSEPTPLTGAEIAAWREAAVQSYDLKLSRDQVLGMLDQVPVPQVRPAYSQISLDPSGNLWAEVGPTAGSSLTSVDYLVFDPEGVLLGVVALPPIRVLEIGDDYVMGVHLDEFEVQYLHVYEIRKPSAGADDL